MKNGTTLLLTLLLVTSAFAQKSVNVNKASDDVRVLIEAPKPYDDVVSKIERLGGVVNYEYKNIDAVAATIPNDRLNEVAGFRESRAIVEDRIITRGEPRSIERSGFGAVSSSVDVSEGLQEVVTDFLSVAPDGYLAEGGLTGAGAFWNATGHFGEGVIIGIMDSGLGDVPAITGRIAGGENFVQTVESLDDGLPAISNLNGDHGTFVASTAGANVAFCFDSASVLSQSVRTHLPESSVPNGCFGGLGDIIPLVGQAPAAAFYALKIFNNSGSTATSVILAAFDRAIELKEKYDAGDPDGVNLRVLNGSFGGSTLYAGDDPFFAGMIESVNAAGIVTVFSAGNNGPSGMTGGDPGTARNTLTVGATNVAAYERVLRDLQFGLGVGALYRPSNSHQTADFSGRGPTADGRTDPDITAPGFAIFVQGAAGGIGVASGTSFSAPNVAGAAALLISAFPDATPEQIRGALLVGADPSVLDDNSGPFDQGHGFLDVMGSYANFGAAPPADVGQETKNVRANVGQIGADIISSRGASRTTGWLEPGERVEFYVETKATDVGLTVQVSVTPELPFAEQNLFFGDDAFVAIHSAKTSSIGSTGDYRAGTPAFVPGTATFVLGPSDLEDGLTRVTVMGDWTNAGRIQAHVDIYADKQGRKIARPVNGKVTDDQQNMHSLRVRPGTSELTLTLDWDSDWSQWPTNDLDLYAISPSNELVIVDRDEDGDADGLSLDAPERVTIVDPEPGTWTLMVDGFTIWNGRESYKIISSTSSGLGKGGVATEEIAGEYELSEAYPNPFNPATQFTLQLRNEQEVTIAIFDLLGRRIATLHDGALSAAENHTFRFDATDLPSGVYLYTVQGESFKESREIVLMK